MPAALQPDLLPQGMVELPSVLDLQAAAPLAGEFLALRGRPVDVDGSHVQRLGGQCLQVLLSDAKTWKADEIPFALVNPSRDLIDGLALLGVPAASFTGEDNAQ